MKTEETTPLQDFLTRCQEDLGFTPKISDTEDPCKIYIEVPEGPPAKTRIMQGHALLGLIAHFKNRNWVKDYSYMFIRKTHYGVLFQPDFSLTDKPNTDEKA